MKPNPNILGFTGYWASGKTLVMVETIMERIAKDPHLIIGENFGFTASPHIVRIENLDAAIQFAATPCPGFRKLLCLDELPMMARARGFQGFPPAADVVFNQGRKLGLSILWTAQHWRFVDVNIRRVTDRLYDCSGKWHKRISEKGALPVVTRPRLISVTRYDNPDPESSNLPKEHDGKYPYPFNQRIADSYETLALVKNAQLLMIEQNEEAKVSGMVQALADAMRGDLSPCEDEAKGDGPSTGDLGMEAMK